jgi:hypothetical protein
MRRALREKKAPFSEICAYEAFQGDKNPANAKILVYEPATFKIIG